MLQHTILSRTLHRAADVEASPVLLSRVIHILTLQVHEHSSFTSGLGFTAGSPCEAWSTWETRPLEAHKDVLWSR
jgi:hypothetical protein